MTATSVIFDKMPLSPDGQHGLLYSMVVVLVRLLECDLALKEKNQKLLAPFKV